MVFLGAGASVLSFYTIKVWRQIWVAEKIHAFRAHFFSSLFWLLHHVLSTCVLSLVTATSDSVADVLHLTPIFQTARFAQTSPCAYLNWSFFQFCISLEIKNQAFCWDCRSNLRRPFSIVFRLFASGIAHFADSLVRFASPGAAFADSLVRIAIFCFWDRSFCWQFRAFC